MSPSEELFKSVCQVNFFLLRLGEVGHVLMRTAITNGRPCGRFYHDFSMAEVCIQTAYM